MAHNMPIHYHTAHQSLFRQLVDEAVILNLETGQYYGLDAIGADIWRRLEAGQDCADIATALTQIYDVDHATARRDVDAFLAQLAAAGLVLVDA